MPRTMLQLYKYVFDIIPDLLCHSYLTLCHDIILELLVFHQRDISRISHGTDLDSVGGMTVMVIAI